MQDPTIKIKLLIFISLILKVCLNTGGKCRRWFDGVYIMEIVTTLFRAKLTQGLADFWVAANAIKARTKIVI